MQTWGIGTCGSGSMAGGVGLALRHVGGGASIGKRHFLWVGKGGAVEVKSVGVAPCREGFARRKQITFNVQLPCFATVAAMPATER